MLSVFLAMISNQVLPLLCPPLLSLFSSQKSEVAIARQSGTASVVSVLTGSDFQSRLQGTTNEISWTYFAVGSQPRKIGQRHSFAKKSGGWQHEPLTPFRISLHFPHPRDLASLNLVPNEDHSIFPNLQRTEGGSWDPAQSREDKQGNKKKGQEWKRGRSWKLIHSKRPWIWSSACEPAAYGPMMKTLTKMKRTEFVA